MKYTKQSLISTATAAGSTATTFAVTHTPGEAWRAVDSRRRWELRQDRMCREIMAAGRYLRRRKTPVALLDRDEYAILADQRSTDLALPCIADCESMAATLTAPYLRRAAAALESAWPYRRSTSGWAGGEHDVSVSLGTPGASCSTDKVWSDNGKWSGTNSFAVISTDLATLMEFPSLMTRDGLALCRAAKIGTREYSITWIEQSTGVSLKTVDGWLIRGYHVRAASIEQARKKAHAARQQQLTASIRERQARQTKRAGLASMRGLYLDTADSIAAGNCNAATDRFACQMWQQIGASGPCAVRADVVLMARDDLYTRRAVGAAMGRAHA